MTNFNPQTLIVPSSKELAICVENDRQAIEDEDIDQVQPNQQPVKESK